MTVIALDAKAEPSDHNLPFVNSKEALPDYELALILSDGGKMRLGAKPDTSAENGLTWYVNKPVSIADIASVRLREQDKVISDSIAEIQIIGESTTQNGYRFDFDIERSLSVGIKSFFSTPIGRAISAVFSIAALLMVFLIVASIFSG